MDSNKVRKFFQMIDFEHTLFGLPFAYMGAVLAAGGIPVLSVLWWITVAMFGARTAALCMNRLIDRHIDRANPRTSHWIMAREELPVLVVWLLVPVFLLIFFYAAYRLNSLCFKLAPLAVFILCIYSYTKRFTWWCHLILGMTIGMGPVGGWLAVTGCWAWTPLFVGAAVASWIAGFDILYACQDIEFDRRMKLYSVPARFGMRTAIGITRCLHLGTIFSLLITGLSADSGWIFYVGLLLIALILAYEHSLVAPGDLSKIYLASFQINHYVGLLIFSFTLLDIGLN